MKHLALVFAFIACSTVIAQDRAGRDWIPIDAFTVPLSALHEVSQADGSIPMKYWGGFIHSLKPVRVRLAGVDIVVFTSVSEYEQRGIYFSSPASSFAPLDGPDRKFHWNEERGYYEFVFTR